VEFLRTYGAVAERMTHDEWRAFLADGTRTGKLATTRKDGRPHVVPIWFVLDTRSGTGTQSGTAGADVVSTTAADSVKGRSLRRDGRAAICVDDERPPFSFVLVEGTAEVSEDLEEMLRFATEIGRRYMGPARAEEFGRRNAVEGELLVRLKPDNVVAIRGVSD
jgi:PPOX class probable F420-dependent enzyme